MTTLRTGKTRGLQPANRVEQIQRRKFSCDCKGKIRFISEEPRPDYPIAAILTFQGVRCPAHLQTGALVTMRDGSNYEMFVQSSTKRCPLSYAFYNVGATQGLPVLIYPWWKLENVRPGELEPII